ncbi:PREDICTED: receptor-like protein 12 [Ipomoea nil]|uniref:receptor-like protein 12 n=1 Tax=Ipomoea nil TaxID=35883 RepID=UPI000901CDB6|nr:PREDICTED: receptor-like protein 12 [Ipomoea nil]
MRILMFTTLVLLSNLIRIIYVMHHVTGECVPDQKSVLLQIRSEITYSASTKLVLWDERVDCCHWPGLSCNDVGYVTTFNLSHDDSITAGFNVSLLLKLPSLSVIMLDGIYFSAPFPDFFQDFKNLTVLSLAGCSFSGTVPPKLFQVPTLQTIDLSYNEILEGSLPDFPENGSLKSLTLEGTLFSGNLPESIGNLRVLSHIDVTGCNFRGVIPASITKLTKLVELRLSGNSFSGPIPASLFFLPSLRSLDLDGNKLSGHINELQNVTSNSPLELLDLRNNNLEGTIPSFFFQFQNLSTLHLGMNKFSGQIPSFFFQLQNLTNLYLSSNKFSGQMIDLQNVTSPLEILDLSSNNLEGIIPSFLFQLQMMVPYLSSNAIRGEIPNWIWGIGIRGEVLNWIWGIGNGTLLYLNLSHNHLMHMKEPMENPALLVVDLNSNLLSGQIPRLPSEAQYLDLSNNNFSMIPLDIGDQIPRVSFFSIANNRLHGSIPISLCHAPNLEVLDLSYNTLFGKIPSCLPQNNTNLAIMNLKGNRLSGEISNKFQEGCSLETLDLNQNMLEGQLPPSLVNCTELKVLNLGNNRLSDTFPCWLNKLVNLHILVLRSNHFHGTISCTKLGVNSSWPSLQVIDLSSNNFSGNLPTQLFLELKAILVDRNEANSKVDYLHFTSPRDNFYYQDSVSLSLKGHDYIIQKILSIFTSIDFSSNQFEGDIPESVGELKLLYLLNISHNALTGCIPQSLENLNALEALDLSFNNLAGSIPEQLESLTFLSFLNLSYNHLVGRIPQGKQFSTFDTSSFMGNKGLCGFQLNVSCNGIKNPVSPLPTLDEKESAYHGDIYASIALGFAVGIRGIFLPLLLSNKWRLYYNKKIDGVLFKVFFKRGQGRRRNHR